MQRASKPLPLSPHSPFAKHPHPPNHFRSTLQEYHLIVHDLLRNKKRADRKGVRDAGIYKKGIMGVLNVQGGGWISVWGQVMLKLSLVFQEWHNTFCKAHTIESLGTGVKENPDNSKEGWGGEQVSA